MTGKKNLKEYLIEWESQLKTFITLFILFSAIYLLFEPIKELGLSILFDPLFSKFSSSTYADFIFTTLFFAGFVFSIVKIFVYDLLPTPRSVLIGFFVLSCYFLLFRWNRDIIYVCFFDKVSIAYCDSVIISGFLLLLRYKAYMKLSILNNSLSFNEDSFDIKNDEDLFARRSIATKLSEVISNSHSHNSFSIAIVGKWGFGKTAFMQFLEEDLKKSNEIIKFNPWKVSDTKQIFDTFFSQLSDTLSKYDHDASNSLIEYADYLTQLDEDNIFSKVAKVGTKLFSGEKSIQKKYDEVNKAISLTGKRFIVFVDDIDRLTGNEIIQVLKLIRNSADFNNLFFITGLDYEYTTNSMAQTKQISFEEGYLQKIFQIELVLPPIRKDFIKIQIEKRLKVESLPEEHKLEFDSAFRKLIFDQTDSSVSMFPGHIFESELENGISNMRDLIRYCNSLMLSYSSLIGEVVLSDLMLLELIKLKSVEIYQLISNRKIIESIDNKGSNQFTLNDKEIIRLWPKDTRLENITIALKLMEILFEEGDRDPRSIVYPGAFEIYIHNQLFKNISLKEYRIYREKPVQEFYRKIKEWFDDKQESNLIQILTSSNLFKNIEELKKFTKLYLLIGAIPKYRNWLTYAFGLFNPQQFILKEYNIDEKKLFDTIDELLFDSEIAFYARSEFASFFLLEIIQNKSTLWKTKEYWLEREEEILREFITENKNEPYDRIAFDIYSNSISYINAANKIVIDPKAQNLMRSYLEARKEEYAKHILRPYAFPPDKKFTFDPWLIGILDGKTNLEVFINSLSSNERIIHLTKELLPKYINVVDKGQEYFVITDENKREEILREFNSINKIQ